MKESPDHLPPWKQNELARVVNVILAASEDVAMVILFGSYARGDYKEEKDLKLDRTSGHASDYDILIVTSHGETAYDTVLWNDAELECRRLGMSAHPKLLIYDIAFVNDRFSEGQYFFKDIKTEGCFLYNTGDYILADERMLLPEERLRIAQAYYDEWFDNAKEFWISFANAFNREKYKHAVFQLHQCVETSYKTLLLVLTNYCPHEHFLGLLGLMVEEHDARVRGLFPQDTEANEERFKLFDYAYIGARYDIEYKISESDLRLISKCAERILELTEKICQERLRRLASSNGSAT